MTTMPIDGLIITAPGPVDIDGPEAPYYSESIISARACTRCGSYVSSLRVAKHDKFHEDLERCLAALSEANGEIPELEVEKPRKSGKKSKKE